MTDAEISRRLALAIGWKHVQESAAGIRALVSETGNMWFAFDYRDPAVIWPIAERFDCFPQKLRADNRWSAPVHGTLYPRMKFADTAAKAVALAVIRHHEESKA